MAEVNEAKREKSQVEDINRSLYDFRYEEKDAYKVDAGLTPAIVEQISREKNDPDWMLELRLKSLEIYNKTGIPEWGPPIDELNMDDIITYVRPNTKMSAKWSEVPTDIKDTFEKLGIPQAERDSLAGVGAQYDSELVYHNVKKEVAEQGCYLHRPGKRHARPLCRDDPHPFHAPGSPHGSQVCRPARRGMVWRFFCVCSAACACGDSPAVLFPPERPRRWPV